MSRHTSTLTCVNYVHWRVYTHTHRHWRVYTHTHTQMHAYIYMYMYDIPLTALRMSHSRHHAYPTNDINLHNLHNLQYTYTYIYVHIHRLRTSVGAFFGLLKRTQTPLKRWETGWMSSPFFRASTGGVTLVRNSEK
jgi:hypothetical protein